MSAVEQGGGTAAAIRANYDAQCRAMVAGDADALGALLSDDFALVHITGYRQSKEEWLADVRSGAMAYHAMEDVDVSVNVSGDAPVVTARTRTAATIWGASATWPLQLRITFSHEGTAWVAAGTVACTWR
jgi:ketosteroid isomerase-like protein